VYITLAAAFALVAAACGGSGFSRDDARELLSEDGAMTEEQVDCVLDGIDDSEGVSFADLDRDEVDDGVAEALAEVVLECAFGDLGSLDDSSDETPDTSEPAATTTTPTATTTAAPDGAAPPGNDPELDALWVRCGDGDETACFDLFWASPTDSDYEAFALDCGGRGTAACPDLDFGESDFTSEFADLSPTDPPPGDDADLDALWVECGAGNADSCDQLFFESPSGSVYERFGFSCGAREVTSCSELLGDSAGPDTSTPGGEAAEERELTDFSDLSPSDPPPGDDADLDALWVGCSDGNADSCDELYFESPFGSVYERFGYSCGAREVAICSDLLG